MAHHVVGKPLSETSTANQSSIKNQTMLLKAQQLWDRVESIATNMLYEVNNAVLNRNEKIKQKLRDDKLQHFINFQTQLVTELEALESLRKNIRPETRVVDLKNFIAHIELRLSRWQKDLKGILESESNRRGKNLIKLARAKYEAIEGLMQDLNNYKQMLHFELDVISYHEKLTGLFDIFSKSSADFDKAYEQAHKEVSAERREPLAKVARKYAPTHSEFNAQAIRDYNTNIELFIIAVRDFNTMNIAPPRSIPIAHLQLSSELHPDDQLLSNIDAARSQLSTMEQKLKEYQGLNIALSAQRAQFKNLLERRQKLIKEGTALLQEINNQLHVELKNKRDKKFLSVFNKLRGFDQEIQNNIQRILQLPKISIPDFLIQYLSDEEIKEIEAVLKAIEVERRNLTNFKFAQSSSSRYSKETEPKTSQQVLIANLAQHNQSISNEVMHLVQHSSDTRKDIYPHPQVESVSESAMNEVPDFAETIDLIQNEKKHAEVNLLYNSAVRFYVRVDVENARNDYVLAARSVLSNNLNDNLKFQNMQDLDESLQKKLRKFFHKELNDAFADNEKLRQISNENLGVIANNKEFIRQAKRIYQQVKIRFDAIAATASLYTHYTKHLKQADNFAAAKLRAASTDKLASNELLARKIRIKNSVSTIIGSLGSLGADYQRIDSKKVIHDLTELHEDKKTEKALCARRAPRDVVGEVVYKRLMAIYVIFSPIIFVSQLFLGNAGKKVLQAVKKHYKGINTAFKKT